MTRCHKCLLLAALGGLVWVAAGSQVGAASVAELAARAKSSDETARLEAIAALAAPGAEAEQAVAVLTELLKDSSAAVRAHAASSLGKIGQPARSAIPNLVSLVADPDECARQQAVGALAAIQPSPNVSIPLFVTLLADADPAVRMRVLHALAGAGPAAVPGMIEALKDNTVAYWACLVLREIGPDAVAAVPALIEKLDDPRPEIRREAILALAAIGRGAAPAADKIATMLDDETLCVAATYALGCVGSIPEGAEATIRDCARSDQSLAATVSQWTLARVHPEDKALVREAIESLVERLKSDDPFVRAAAARGLASLSPTPEVTLPAIDKMLDDSDETTARHALDALAVIGQPAVPCLIEALKHDGLRLEVAYLLGQIGPAAAPATDVLVELVGDDDPAVAREAVQALAKIGPGAKAATTALVGVLGQPESEVRHAAVYALGKIGPDAAAAESALASFLDDDDASLALVAAWALVEIKGPSAETAATVLPALVSALESPLAASRRAAAETLGHLGPAARAAVEPLGKARNDADEGVRRAVSEALKAIGS